MGMEYGNCERGNDDFMESTNTVLSIDLQCQSITIHTL